MRISDWSSDVCSSDLEGACQRCLGARRRDRRAGGDAVGHRAHCRHLGAELRQSLPDVVILERAGTKALPRHVDEPLDDCAVTDVFEHTRSAALESEGGHRRSEEHTSELQSLMRNSYAVFCLKKK